MNVQVSPGSFVFWPERDNHEGSSMAVLRVRGQLDAATSFFHERSVPASQFLPRNCPPSSITGVQHCRRRMLSARALGWLRRPGCKSYHESRVWTERAGEKAGLRLRVKAQPPDHGVGVDTNAPRFGRRAQEKAWFASGAVEPVEVAQIVRWCNRWQAEDGQSSL